jgi:hypothetical protein
MLAVQALQGFMPGCEDAKLRNFGMTLGIRDTRKLDAAYNMTGEDVRGQRHHRGAHPLVAHFPGPQLLGGREHRASNVLKLRSHYQKLNACRW